jgi:hypothetical protein
VGTEFKTVAPVDVGSVALASLLLPVLPDGSRIDSVFDELRRLDPAWCSRRAVRRHS